MFKQFLLAATLIAVPVVGFTAFEIAFAPGVAQAASLGDLSSMKTIITDVQGIADTGDMAAAEKRITDFETAWDEAEATLRPKNKDAWATVDDAADAALHALRKGTPDPAKVKDTLVALAAVLDNPTPGESAAKGVQLVSGIAVTDESGHALACESMIQKLKDVIRGNMVAQDKLASANDFLTKALERCNSDDDAHADEFSAQGLALASK
jgi:hypothetical protein